MGSQVIQLALQTKRALAEGRGAPDDQASSHRLLSKIPFYTTPVSNKAQIRPNLGLSGAALGVASS